MISLAKLKVLTPLQKIPKNVRDLGKLIVWKVAQSPMNCPIWSHWVKPIPKNECGLSFQGRQNLDSLYSINIHLPNKCGYDQFDQIGLFLKDRGFKFYYKSSPNIWLLFGLVLNLAPDNWNLLWLVKDNFRKLFGLLFNPTSGHTGWGWSRRGIDLNYNILNIIGLQWTLFSLALIC